MKVFAPALALFLLFNAAASAQYLTCPSPYIYMDGGNFIKAYDPSQPLSSTNPFNTNIPTLGGNGLAIMPNINGGTLCPTFYGVSGGTYHYWDGTSWVNTGHSTGNSAAVNIGGCGSFIYNLVGASGDVYVYDGSSNGAYLTTITGFSSGGPFDLTTDCDCNFYSIHTSTAGPGQVMTKFSPAGVPMATFALSGIPNSSAGGGFGMIGNMVYLKNNLANGFFIGTINGSTVTFTQMPGFTGSPGDFASCPTCTTPPAPLNVQISTASLSCFNPTASLFVTTPNSPVTYSWSGPGIVGSNTGSMITLNASGLYSCQVIYTGCPGSSSTISVYVPTFTNYVAAGLNVTGSLCIPTGSVQQLIVTHNSTNESVSWTGPGITGAFSDTVLINTPGTYSVVVTDPATGCTGTNQVTFAHGPTVTLVSSSGSLCGLPLNGSPASVSVTASGASNYTFYPDGYLNANVLTNSVALVTAAFNGVTTGSLLVVGRNSYCIDSAVINLQIYPNPTVIVNSGSICPGGQYVFQASGAQTYTWGGLGLSGANGATVTAAPQTSSSYSVLGTDHGCRSGISFATIFVQPVPVVNVAPAAGQVCLGTPISFTASGTATSYTWSPVTGLSALQGSVVSAVPPATQVYTVTGSLNGCTAQATATALIQNPPTLSLNMSAQYMCFYNYNGSPNSLTLVPGGATAYTLLTSPGYSVNNPTSPVMQLMPDGPAPQFPYLATATLLGQQGVCSATLATTFSIIPNPVVDISPQSASICPGESATFTPSGADTYTWGASPYLKPHQQSGVVANPKVTSFFPVVGTWMGCKSSTKNAVLLVKPLPTFSVTASSKTVCTGNAVNLTVFGTAASYEWWPKSSLNISTGQTVTAVPLTNTTYSVIGTLNSCTNQAVTTVSAVPIPTVLATTVESVVCAGSRVYLQASGALSYSWMPFDLLNATEGSTVYSSPMENTTYTVWGFNGTCSGSTSVFVRTVKQPDISLESVNGQNAICAGSQLTVALDGADSYSWSPSQYVEVFGSNTTAILRPQVTTNFTVLGQTIDGTVTCPQVVSFSVMVVPGVQPIAPSNYTICAGQKVVLEAKGGSTYSWSPSDGLNHTALSRVVANPIETTVYTVHISHDTYCGNSTTVMVEVYPVPEVYAGKDTTWHINDQIYLNGSGTGTLSWVSGEGISCTNCPTTQVYPSRNNCYLLEAVNEFGCINTDDVCLSLNEDFSLYIPNSFTPNNKDGLNDLFMVYGESVTDFSIQIFDRWGEMVYQSNDINAGWDGNLRGQPCKRDVYTYKVSYKGLDHKTYHKIGHITLIR